MRPPWASEGCSVKLVIPVKTGIQETEETNWIPACAGMTVKKDENR
jgi:hypothetical protein